MVFSDTWEARVHRLNVAFGRSKLNGKRNKKSVTYLGKAEGQSEVHPLQAKAVAIDHKYSASKKELMRL